jgi:hypothetical protein
MELTEEERRRLSRPSFRMSGAGGRRPQGPLSTGLQGSGEAAATIGSAVLGSVPAGLAGLAALPFKGPQGAARAVEDVQEALTYVPRTQEGVKAVQGAVGPLSAMGAPAEYIGEKTRQATGSPALATAAEVVLDPLNLIGSAVAGKAAASGARAVGRGAQVAARELGPKAAEMAEGYMRRSGMMPQAAPSAPSMIFDDVLMKTAVRDSRDATGLIDNALQTDAQGVIRGRPKQLDRDLARGLYTESDVQKSFASTLDQIRSRFGDTVKLWRADAPVGERNPDTRTVFMADEATARQYEKGGREAKPYIVNTDDILGVYARPSGYREVIVRSSALNEQRLPKTETPAFKEFTAGAPVIKADQASKAEFQTGKPVVIEGFHGTRRGFEAVDAAQASAGYFTTSKPMIADEYAGVYPEGMGGGSFPTGGNVQRSYVRMDNPLFVNARGASFNRIDTRGVPGFGLPMSNTDMLNQWAKQQGYDGVIYKDLRDSIARPGGQNVPASNVYVSFNPNYVKSAIGNRGTFDVREKDMAKAGGGAVEGGNMSFAGAADEIARKLVSQGMSQDQAMMLALRMSDARMKAGGAVMMAGGGLLKGAARAAGKAAEKAETRLAGALKPQQAPVRGQTSQELRQMQAQQLTPEQQEMLSNLQRRYPDFGAASRFMTPQEIIKVVERPENAQAMNRLLQVLPESRNLAAVAKAGDPKRGWYRASTQAIIDVFGVDDAPRFSALLAAMSPQTSVEMNLLNTLNTWTNWNAAGRPTNPDAIKRIMGQSVAGTGTEASVLDAWSNNSVRALTAPDPTKVTLSGPKVDSFYRNLADDVYRVTNDAWMASGLGVSQGMFSGSPTALQLQRGDPGMSPGYMATSARMREAGQRAGILPAEAQETTWSFFMPLYEMQAKTGLPAREILQRGLLTPEQIRGTPDFSTLLSTGRYGDILRRGGYEEELSRLKPYEFGGEKVDLSLPEQREVERAAQRLEALRGMRTTESESRSISLPKKGEKPKSAFVTTPYEVIPGAGVGLGEGMVTAPFGTRANYSSAISSTMRDPMGRDRLQKAVGLNPLPTRGATGAFRPSGGVPFQGSSSRESFTQRAAMENQPAFGSTSKVQLTQRGDIPKDVKRRLDATEAARGYMTGQHGMTWNAQIPDPKGKSMFLQRQEKATPDEMGYAYNMLNDEGFVADTGAGVAVIHNEYMPNNPPFQDVEQDRMQQIFNPQRITPTRNVSNYIDFSEDWMKPQGSGSATRKLLGKTDELPPKERGALSREMKDISGDLYDIFSRREAKTGDPYRVDVMRALQILRDKGLPGLAAALAAGEALPSEEQRARGGLTALSR